MKSNLVLAALKIISIVAIFSISSVAYAFAGEPIDGIDVKLGKNPGGSRVASGETDGRGNVIFRNVGPGDYEIFIDGPTLVKAMDRLAPSTPARQDSGPSVSLGIGGMFGGGGSHHSSGGAGPTGGESHSGRTGGLAVDPNDPNGNRVNSGGSSTGGVGLGVNVPIGGDSDATTINGNLQIADTLQIGGGSGGFSVSQGYCRETAGQGMRLGFKISENESPRPQDVTFTITFGGSLAGSQ